MERGQVVLVDTNIIIEAVRTHCWNALIGYFCVETVAACLEEARTGDSMRRDYVPVTDEQLEGLHEVHTVSTAIKARFAIALPAADELDVGERELFAHVLDRSDAWIASCADRAALKAAFALGWRERIVSLEALVRSTRADPQFKEHFRERWLSEVRTAFLLDGGL